MEPVSRIHEQKDIDTFYKTEAFDRIMTFVALLNESVHKKKISDPCLISTVMFRKLNLALKTFSIANRKHFKNARHFGFLVK